MFFISCPRPSLSQPPHRKPLVNLRLLLHISYCCIRFLLLLLVMILYMLMGCYLLAVLLRLCFMPAPKCWSAELGHPVLCLYIYLCMAHILRMIGCFVHLSPPVTRRLLLFLLISMGGIFRLVKHINLVLLIIHSIPALLE